MMTRNDELIEEIANQQLKAMREVLNDLKDLAGVDELPGEYYWFRGTDYISMDKYGSLEAWSSGCRGQPDERSGFNFKLDESVITWKEGERYQDGSQDDRTYEHDVEAFKAKLRAKLLPEFNKLRAAKRANLEATIKSSQAKLASMQGDIA